MYYVVETANKLKALLKAEETGTHIGTHILRTYSAAGADLSLRGVTRFLDTVEQTLEDFIRCFNGKNVKCFGALSENFQKLKTCINEERTSGDAKDTIQALNALIRRFLALFTVHEIALSQRMELDETFERRLIKCLGSEIFFETNHSANVNDKKRDLQKRLSYLHTLLDQNAEFKHLLQSAASVAPAFVETLICGLLLNDQSSIQNFQWKNIEMRVSPQVSPSILALRLPPPASPSQSSAAFFRPIQPSAQSDAHAGALPPDRENVAPLPAYAGVAEISAKVVAAHAPSIQGPPAK